MNQIINFSQLFRAVNFKMLSICGVSSFHQHRFSSNTWPTNSTNNTKTVKEFSEQNIDFSKLNPDKFGDLFQHYSDNRKHGPLKSESIKDDADGYDKLEIKRGIKKSLPAYQRILIELYQKKPLNVKEMLNLHHQFIYEDRYIPERNMYTILIDSCAKVGYTKKAIELYEEMKRFELKPTRATITALFNACANCTFTKEYGLEMTFYLRKELELIGHEFNEIQYNSMIKAFARLGDLKTAYLTMDEMLTKGHKTSIDTFSMILMGCISDREQGLFHAFTLFDKFLKSGNHLNVSFFNLFLRCIRDCRIGNENNLLKICHNLTNDNNKKLRANDTNDTNDTNKGNHKSLKDITLSNQTGDVPSLLTGLNADQIISIDFKSLASPKNRFLLFGGVDNFFRLMQAYQIKPDIKTVTLVVDLISVDDSLDKITNILQQFNMKPDVTLYNVLIKNACKFRKYKLSQQILNEMVVGGIQPDIMTFGALTFGCNNFHQAKKLLSDMHACNVIPNNPIIGSFIINACSREDLNYLNFIMTYVERINIKLTKIDIEKINLLLQKTRSEISNFNRKDVKISQHYADDYEKLSYNFQRYLKNVNIEVNENPWEQYQLETDTVKNKSKYNSFVSYMKKKTDIKLNKEKGTIADYNDELDD